MTAAEKKLLQETHDSVIKLKTIIIGNGVAGMAERVRENSDFIARIKDLPETIQKLDIKIEKHKREFDKVYYKILGGGIAVIAIGEILLKFLVK